ncbi:MAG: helix-turn-helix domain-containing protein, partial [Desulfobacterales bacterium]|nr:helix-turn-helix domain-containing protein [Desulfobacterales bacterium]
MITEFGNRLKSARKMAGLSMGALAEKAGKVVSRQAISKYENGQMNPGSDTLISLSRALAVKPDYFFRPQKIAVLSKMEFRKKSGLGRKEEESVRYRTLDFLERYAEIEKILDENAVFKNPVSKNRVLAQADLEAAAGELRRKWALGDGPISNLMELLEGKGVRIYEIESGKTFRGISAMTGNIPVIAVNARDDLLQKRFTIAHELGHITLTFNDKDERKAREKLCHAFAGAFLLPENEIKTELGARRSQIALWELKKLKGIYGISIQKIMARANRLGIITDYTYRNFRISANKRGWKREEPGEYLGKERPNR